MFMQEPPGIYADFLVESTCPLQSRVEGFRHCAWNLGDLCGNVRVSMQIFWLNQRVLQGRGSGVSDAVRGTWRIYAGTLEDLCGFLG